MATRQIHRKKVIMFPKNAQIFNIVQILDK